ncbi:hypothetical protein [Paenibacillus woosongensis]|uniref:Butirosin biosynthesis protein H N-terminal domain-containing protein n=1 Tax=Paenibacillus woosongensis TaxID=307580 RepID=A0A7X2Z0L5_9BACL|nr:hypothetical protein [Paenibacillus woosongensis]MUG45273.1 hypothetical protein [Paenibacillus woosongensis]
MPNLNTIKPFIYEAFDCMENAVATIATWRKMDYEYMYLKSWRFSYEGVGLPNVWDISQRIELPDDDKFHLLEKYHGIKTTYHSNLSKGTILELARGELSAGRPLTVGKESYSTKSDDYVLLLFGFSVEEKVFYGYKITHFASDIQWQEIPFDEFFDGCNICNTFQFNSVPNLRIDPRQLLTESILNVNTLMMKKLQTELEEGQIFEGIISNNYIEAADQILDKFVSVGLGHIKYAISLNYLADHSGWTSLLSPAKSISNLGREWRILRGMLIKGRYSKNKTEILTRIMNKLNDIINQEEKVYCKIQSLK